jgi:hypothetical protein
MSTAHNSQWTASLVGGAQRAAPLQASLALARVAVFLLARNSVG